MNLRSQYAGGQPTMPLPMPPESIVLAGIRSETSTARFTRKSVDFAALSKAYAEGGRCFDRGEWKKAEQAFKQVIALLPSSEAYTLLGYAYFYQKDFLQASNSFEKAARLNPGNLTAHFSLALAYRRLNKLDKAIKAVRNVIRLDATNADARFLLGYLYAGASRWREAEAAYREAIRLRWNFSEAYQYLAMLQLEVADAEPSERMDYIRQAASVYREMVEAGIGGAIVYVNLGFVYERLGERELAAESYRQAGEMAGDNLMELVAVGTGLLDVKSYEEARSAFSKALLIAESRESQRDVSRAQILTWLGVATLGVYTSRESNPADDQLLSEAERWLKDATEADARYIHAHINLGTTYYFRERLEEAARAFEKVIALDPENKSARNNLIVVLEDVVERRLHADGLLKHYSRHSRPPAAYERNTPIVMRGTPLSEMIAEDRR